MDPKLFAIIRGMCLNLIPRDRGIKYLKTQAADTLLSALRLDLTDDNLLIGSEQSATWFEILIAAIAEHHTEEATVALIQGLEVTYHHSRADLSGFKWWALGRHIELIGKAQMIDRIKRHCFTAESPKYKRRAGIRFLTRWIQEPAVLAIYIQTINANRSLKRALGVLADYSLKDDGKLLPFTEAQYRSIMQLLPQWTRRVHDRDTTVAQLAWKILAAHSSEIPLSLMQKVAQGQELSSVANAQAFALQFLGERSQHRDENEQIIAEAARQNPNLQRYTAAGMRQLKLAEIDSLASRSDTESTQRLIDLTSHRDGQVQVAAVKVLSDRKVESVTRALVDFVRHRSINDYEAYALRALEARQGPMVEAVLIEIILKQTCKSLTAKALLSKRFTPSVAKSLQAAWPEADTAAKKDILDLLCLQEDPTKDWIRAVRDTDPKIRVRSFNILMDEDKGSNIRNHWPKITPILCGMVGDTCSGVRYSLANALKVAYPHDPKSCYSALLELLLDIDMQVAARAQNALKLCGCQEQVTEHLLG